MDPIACAHCGELFEPAKSWQLFCCTEHRMAHHAAGRYPKSRAKQRALLALLEEVERFLQLDHRDLRARDLLKRVRDTLGREAPP